MTGKMHFREMHFTEEAHFTGEPWNISVQIFHEAAGYLEMSI
jgi:hypothetical protein